MSEYLAYQASAAASTSADDSTATKSASAADADALESLRTASEQLRKALTSLDAPPAAAGGRGKGKAKATRAQPLDVFEDDGGAAGDATKFAALLGAASVAIAAANVALRPTDVTGWQPLADVARFACLRCVHTGGSPDWKAYSATMKALLPKEATRAEV